MMKRDVSGLSFLRVSARCVPSTFDTKWTRGPVPYGFKASVTISGPWTPDDMEYGVWFRRSRALQQSGNEWRPCCMSQPDGLSRRADQTTHRVDPCSAGADTNAHVITVQLFQYDIVLVHWSCYQKVMVSTPGLRLFHFPPMSLVKLLTHAHTCLCYHAV